MDEWMKAITKEDVPEKYHPMIDAIGLMPFLRLMTTHGGTYFYIPKADVVLQGILNPNEEGLFYNEKTG